MNDELEWRLFLGLDRISGGNIQHAEQGCRHR
jgi:hypothetical protein